MRLIDIDNCIANDEWRIGAIGLTKDGEHHFHMYHSLSIWDEFRNTDLYEDARESIVILTARPVLYRSITEEVLRRNNVPYRYLLMRNNDDHRNSVTVKCAQVGWLLDHYDVPLRAISGAYDDRPEVVDMYRAQYGIHAEVRAIHSTPYPKHNEL